MSRKNNWPTGSQPEVSEDELTEDLRIKVRMMELPKVNIKDGSQIKERIREYFDICAENHRRPGVEGLALALGTNRMSLWKWQQEQSERGEAIRQAKQLIIAMIESWNIEGRLNPVSSIFLLKNLAGYQDSIKIEAEQTGAVRPEHTPEQIAKIIEQEIPIDD